MDNINLSILSVNAINGEPPINDSTSDKVRAAQDKLDAYVANRRKEGVNQDEISLTGMWLTEKMEEVGDAYRACDIDALGHLLFDALEKAIETDGVPIIARETGISLDK